MLISETHLTGAPLGNGGQLNLGQPFDPAGAQDLRFFYGLTDGTFVRGLVEYIAAPDGVAGDYNNNNVVDAADYVVWRNSVGQSITLPNDPIGGTIGAAHYNQWRANFGRTPGAGSVLATVPEPTSLVLLALASIGCCIRRRPLRASI